MICVGADKRLRARRDEYLVRLGYIAWRAEGDPVDGDIMDLMKVEGVWKKGVKAGGN